MRTGGGVQVAGDRIIGTKSTSEADGCEGCAAEGIVETVS